MKEKRKKIIADLHLETAKIPWSDLQRFFAAGKLLFVDSSLDMLDVAASLVENDVDRLQNLIESNLVFKPNDDKAKKWVEQKALLWAVVLNPWVLIQENDE